MRLAWLPALLAATSGCYSAPPSEPVAPAPKVDAGATFTLRGKLVNADTKAGLDQSIVFIEVGGRYLKNPDPSKGHPDYRFAVATNKDGTFEARDIPPGKTATGEPSAKWGLHTFQNGFKYGTDILELDPSGAPKNIEVTVAPHGPNDAKPSATDFKVSPTKVAPSAEVEFTANVTAPPGGDLLADGGISGDPLSEEVLIAEVTTQWARAMDPPSRGIQGQAFPNGIWRHKGPAPSKPGTYTFELAVSSERCITSDRVKVALVVE